MNDGRGACVKILQAFQNLSAPIFQNFQVQFLESPEVSEQREKMYLKQDKEYIIMPD